MKFIFTISMLWMVALGMAQPLGVERIHENTRSHPYPQGDNAVCLNPAPLIVPVEMKTAELLQFAISMDKAFPKETTVVSEPKPWCMFNLHKQMKPGKWYWRFRSVGTDGKTSEWSRTYTFVMGEQVPVFVTPAYEAVKRNIPERYPRLFCFLDEGLKRNRNSVRGTPDYKQMIGRANGALKRDISSVKNPYKMGTKLSLDTRFLHTAYLVTGDKKYADRMEAYTRLFLNFPMDRKMVGNDFYDMALLTLWGYTYDTCFERFTKEERARLENMILTVAQRHHMVQRKGAEENHLFDNHFWQSGFRGMLQTALLLYGKHPVAEEMLEYCYELWTAKAPASGLNRDGIWHNGNGYFNANMFTMCYSPLLFKHLTGFDFLSHPWYKNVGRGMLYTWPPKSWNAGFGDGNEKSNEPPRQRVAFADFIARETGDPYAAWYADYNANWHSDFDLRLYRMANPKNYDGSRFPKGAPKAYWFKDCGEMEAHTDLQHPGKGLFLSFRSSPFGSGSHTLADQNCFNLHYRGVPVYRSTGYYLNFSDAHNLMSYRHTRAHNTLLVAGKGQPFTTRAYGVVTRMLDGDHLSYATGDASHAYCGISEYPMWQKNFENSGLEQSAENGFGDTPLKKYKRHIFLLHPDKVLIYDEMEADSAVTWDWLLHSFVKFDIDDKQNCMITLNPEKGFKARTTLFGTQDCTLSQTDAFVAPPDSSKLKKGRDTQIPNQWHLTAAYPSSKAHRVLAIIQVNDLKEEFEKINVQQGNFCVGEWNIEAQLDAGKLAALRITNAKKKVVFTLDDELSTLVDSKNGKRMKQEVGDLVPVVTAVNN